jgi:hypothetical protein
MPRAVAKKIGDLDFSFENSPVTIIANRNCPEIKLAGLTIGPFDEGNEYETRYWVALELEKAGIAHFREDESLGTARLNKIQWTECVQTSGQISRLPDDFYPKLRRCLVQLKQDAAQSPEKMREYERAKQLTQDIINSRMKKIISIASTSTKTEHILKNLTQEERLLYEHLYRIVNEWKTQISDYEGAKE